ncbi:hypothetical protein [Haloterrigena salinisoli]|uniref:hypothetical protein n=1 Tax=Haloterrigena salinisoli TaxID=3132747 RepID=UPI0030D28FB5
MVDSNPVGRRTVLRRTVTLGTAGIAGCLRSETPERNTTKANSDSSPDKTDSDQVSNDGDDTSKDAAEDEWFEKGAITFTYDDGPIENLEEAFLSHETYDAPATVGIVSDWMGRTDERWMTDDEVTRLADAG